MKEQKKLKRKAIIAMIAMTIFTMFTIMVTPAQAGLISFLQDIESALDYSGIDIPEVIPISTIIDWLVAMASSCSQIVADAFFKAMAHSFSPSFVTIIELQEMKDVGPGMTLDYVQPTKEQVFGTYFFIYIWSMAALIGHVIATLLFLYNIILMICGKAEAIKDTPASLLLRYILVEIGIFLSKEIVYYAMDFVSNLWQHYIVLSSSGELLSFHTLFPNDINAKAEVVDGEFSFLGLTFKAVQTILPIMENLIMPIVMILLVFKFCKAILHLYLEVMERYFVLIIMSVCFPAALATLTSNQTKNIMGSYMRMFFCQCFVMFANMAFIKVFILIGVGWVQSIFNIFAAFAYIKVCQRLDSYMMAMGLNVAQTGGGLGGSILGSLSGLASTGMMLARGFNGASGSNRGLSTDAYNKAVSNNDFATAQKIASSNGTAFSERQFAEATKRVGVAKAEACTVDVGNGTLNEAFTKAGVTTAYMDNLSNANLDMEKISKIQNMGDGVTSRFMDEDGNVIASMDKNGRVYSKYDDNGEMDYIRESAKFKNQERDIQNKAMELCAADHPDEVWLGNEDAWYSVTDAEREQYLTDARDAYFADNDSLSYPGDTYAPSIDLTQFESDGYSNIAWENKLSPTSDSGYWEGSISATSISTGEKITMNIGVYDNVYHPDMATAKDSMSNLHTGEYRTCSNNRNLTIHKSNVSEKNPIANDMTRKAFGKMEQKTTPKLPKLPK